MMNCIDERRTRMVKAVVQNGVIVPRDPLPQDWREGTRVEVQKAPEEAAIENSANPTDVWMDEVEAIASQGDPADDKRLDAAIQDVRRREKDLARKKLGLNP
jgi:hypothetical protein